MFGFCHQGLLYTTDLDLYKFIRPLMIQAGFEFGNGFRIFKQGEHASHLLNIGKKTGWKTRSPLLLLLHGNELQHQQTGGFDYIF